MSARAEKRDSNPQTANMARCPSFGLFPAYCRTYAAVAVFPAVKRRTSCRPPQTAGERGGDRTLAPLARPNDVAGHPLTT